MTIPYGTEIYNLNYLHVSSQGVYYSSRELNSCLEGPVSKTLFDNEGTDILRTLLSGVAETNFEHENVKRILYSKQESERWRVGEALAESYLVAHRNCFFPWPVSRDKKKERASLPGTDLVGFQEATERDNRFAFGEVKTSEQEKYPPSVMYGQHGLKHQLEDLCSNVSTRDTLVKYLAHRAQGSSWVRQYKDSAKRYLANNLDVSLFGIMVRDVDPHTDDLFALTRNLAEISSPPLSVELLALYLPAGSIENLSSKVRAVAQEGN
ncbi:MAG: hypothetical protein JSV88_08430 [Candidatus Aminicenantes bacterium]|nr:MAG: hypothetical protein JSV88_08430 [Candidatus Aminicenantes bacterium]